MMEVCGGRNGVGGCSSWNLVEGVSEKSKSFGYICVYLGMKGDGQVYAIPEDNCNFFNITSA